MLLRRRPKSRLDLIFPDIRARVEEKQRARVEEKQMIQKMQHDQHAKDRRIDPGDHVLVRNFAPVPKLSSAQVQYRSQPNYPMDVSCDNIKVIFCAARAIIL